MTDMIFFDGKLESIKNAILKVHETSKLFNQNQLNCLDTIIKVLEDKKNYTNSKIFKYELELLDSII